MVHNRPGLPGPGEGPPPPAPGPPPSAPGHRPPAPPPGRREYPDSRRAGSQAGSGSGLGMLRSPGGSRWQVGSVRSREAAAGAAAAAAGRTGAAKAGQERLLAPRELAGERELVRSSDATLPGFHSAAGGLEGGIPAAAATLAQVSRGSGGENRSPGANKTPSLRAWPEAMERSAGRPGARGRERSPRGVACVPGGHSPRATTPGE